MIRETEMHRLESPFQRGLNIVHIPEFPGENVHFFRSPIVTD